MRVLRRPVLLRNTLAAVMVVFVALAGRLVQIQLSEGDRLVGWTERQRRSIIRIPCRRGMIVDARGRPMAVSLERPSVFADPNSIPHPSVLPDPNRVSGRKALADPNVAGQYQKVAEVLGDVLGLNPEILADELMCRAGKRFFWVKRRVSDEQAEAISKLGLRGIGIVHEPERRYPMNERFAHGLGFVNREGTALAGLELQLDEALRGRPGYRTVVTDGRRRPIYSKGQEYRAPKDGDHVVLTIDSVLQAMTEEELSGAIKQFEGKAGTAIVIDPGTGEVLALANSPTFDLNDYANYPESARCNLAIQAPVEPGSTFKPFIAAAALQEKVTWPGEEIFCHHGLYVAGRRRLHDHHPYGTLTFENVLIKSSNIGMAILGQRLGNDRLHEYIRRFGFGRPTGLELPGEDSGIVLPLRRWTSYSTTSLPMGQEVSVTPMQLATAFSAVVNDGVMLKPRVVRAIVRSDGTVVEDRSEPVVVGQVVEAPVARRIAQDILARVVSEGTGKRAALAGYKVLGKTGTAQIARKDGPGYEPDAYVSSFVGAAPAEAPRVLVYLSVIRPKKKLGYYGGTVAAPAVREILAKTLAYLDVPPTQRPDNSVQMAQR